jgi:ribosomal-protein-alanine N-acetyltransferase
LLAGAYRLLLRIVIGFISAHASTMVQSDYLLTSERLGFRLFEDADFPDLQRLDMDPDVRAHFPDGIATSAQINARIERSRLSIQANGYAEFAVIELETGRFAGRAGFGPIDDCEIEVGYVFLKEFWGRGLAQESLRALLPWAKENLTVPRIIAYAPCTHSASLNVMKKAGMRFFKTDNAHGVACDFYQYSL